MDRLCQKAFYLYEWIDGIDKLDCEGIPPIEAFPSQLKHESVLQDDGDDDKENKRINTIIQDNQEHGLKVYDALKCKKLTDYHETYLMCDVLLLADVFENCRTTSISY